MKKIIINLIFLIIFLFIAAILALSTIGIETNKFNKFVSEEVVKNKNINLKLDTIKFKIDLQKINLFLETNNPEINYENLKIPIKILKCILIFYHYLNQIQK